MTEQLIVDVTQTPAELAAIAVLLLTALTSAGLVFVARRHDEISGSTWFAAVMLSVCFWASVYVLQLASSTPGAIRRWQSLKFVAIAVVPYLWFSFTMTYCGYTRFTSRRRLVLLAVVPTVSVVLVSTNELHHLFWLSRGPAGAFAAPSDVNGPAFWLHAVYSYVLLFVGTASLLWTFLRTRTLYRGQTVLLLAASSLPWLANVSYLLGWSPISWLDPTPIAFALTGVFFAIAIYYYRLLELVPVAWELARDVAIEDMTDGAIVLDVRNRVIDLNSTATAVLGVERADVLGRPLGGVSGACARLAESDSPTDELETFVDWEWRYYEVQRSPVSTVAGRRVGQVITLRDVTERKTREQRLEVQNRLLRHNLRNDLNVVLGYLELLDETIDDPEQREFLRRALTKSETLLNRGEKSRRVGKFLDRQIRPTETNLVPVVERTVSICCERFPNATITTELPDTLSVLCDEGMDLVVLELVENAVEHTDGPARIDITATVADGVVELRVADDGPGIPPHERAVLDSDRETPLSHSTGIGLWLVRWMVVRYGGSVRLEDKEAHGTVVVLSLKRTANRVQNPTVTHTESGSR